MPSVLNVDTLTDAAGTGPVTLTKQSAAKAWFVYDQSADTIDNSISISSISDTSTGVFTSNFLNTFTAKPCPVGMCSYYSFCNTRNAGGDAITTSDTDFSITNSSNVATDRNEISVSFHGDLA